MFLSLLVLYYDVILSRQYKQQVIAILNDDDYGAIHEAARYLSLKEDVSTISHVVVWDQSLNKFVQAEWDKAIASYKKTTALDLPIGRDKLFQWSDTHVQVVGHGEYSDYTKKISFSGADPENIIDRVTAMTKANNKNDLADIKRISIVGCTMNDGAKLIKIFMELLKKKNLFKTKVSIRSALVCIDQNGRKLTGELHQVMKGKGGKKNDVGIEWSHKNNLHKYVGSFDRRKKISIEQGPVNVDELKTYNYGFLPLDSEVYISSNDKSWKVSVAASHQWLNSLASDTYKDIVSLTTTPDSVGRKVKFFDDGKVYNQEVIEIKGIEDLQSLLKYYADLGPNIPQQYDREHMSKPITIQGHNAVCLRFGDFVLKMNLENFYVHVKGVVISESDSNEKNVKVENLMGTLKKGIPRDYPNMHKGTSEDFIDDVSKWVSGQHSTIELEPENAFNAQCGVAMFFSESIRSFHNHITNMMILDLAEKGYLKKEFIFNYHPMARGGTWQKHENGRKMTGLDLLKGPEQSVGVIIERMQQITRTWFSHIHTDSMKGLRRAIPGLEVVDNMQDLMSVLRSLKPRESNLRGYELSKATEKLLVLPMKPVIESVKTQVGEFTTTSDISLPLRSSIALANDHAFVCNAIAEELELKQQQTGKKYDMLVSTLEFEENSVKIEVVEKNNPLSSDKKLTLETSIDTSKLGSKEIVKNLQRNIQLSTSVKISKGMAVYGAIRGLVGSIDALERGDITEGFIGVAQSFHGLSELKGYNQMIYIAAGKFLGKALRKSVSNLAKVVKTEEMGKLIQESGSKIISTIGEVSKLMEYVPVIGTAFGIYNIYEDLLRHSTIGYVDYALDLILLSPESGPVVLALTIIRMGIDSFYNKISEELTSLPPNATVVQKVESVFKGIGEALLTDLILPDMIHETVSYSHKLDEQYNKDQEFVKKMADEQNYYTIENSSIDFTKDKFSWNGGRIRFCLGERDQSTLFQELPSEIGHKITINTSGVEDIVLGIGESHSIEYTKESAKLFWIIPIYSKYIITGRLGEKKTLHGTYHGNSRNNKFIAVQHVNKSKSMDFELNEYHYNLYGNGGDDTFYLGPQQSYVEGNDGKDTYFISSSSVCTKINNYAEDGIMDFMVINLNYSQLNPHRVKMNLSLSVLNTHTIIVYNWFYDSTYQHMNFKTIDGVFFLVSATNTESVELVAYALSGVGSTRKLSLDAREKNRTGVLKIVGSDYSDIIYGNSLNNYINGGKGNDTLTGGEGKDTYIIDPFEGVDYINNYATDGKIDTLFLGVRLDNISSFIKPGTNDLYLMSSNQQVQHAVIKNWTIGDRYRHLILVTQDGIVLNVSSSVDPMQVLLADMSLIKSEGGGNNVTGTGGYYVNIVFNRQLNLSADPLLFDVVTILGSPDNDSITANHRDNYMTGGGGFDMMVGKEGADVYVVKQGDGMKLIDNFALDNVVDTILFDADFHNITLSSQEQDLILFSTEKLINVTVINWFLGPMYQHLVLRSTDGVIFEQPTSSGSLKKTAIGLDYSKKNLTNGYINLADGEWNQVEHVVGSRGNVTIIGNSLNNYIDPNIGASFLQGNNGSDTYIIKPEYGIGNVINNAAKDSDQDVLFYHVPFPNIHCNNIQGTNDIQLTSTTGKGQVDVKLINYVTDKKSRHLTIVSDDGISFIIPAGKDCQLIPIAINRAQATTGQHFNLMANSAYFEVLTMYGSSNHQNNIVGNSQNNTLIGGSLSDYIDGLDGNDVLKGGNGDDTIYGRSGTDMIMGGDGNDVIDGGDDDDIISPGFGNNQVNGGSGYDTLIYSGDVYNEKGIHLRLTQGFCNHTSHGVDYIDQIVSIEQAFGTEYDDILEGDAENNVLVGQGGDDHLFPGATGYDILNGGQGHDTYDLSDTNGTVTLENYATDGALDKVIITSNMADFSYVKFGENLIIRVIDKLNGISYDGSKPIVIFKEWYCDPILYNHAYIQASDGNITCDSVSYTNIFNYKYRCVLCLVYYNWRASEASDRELTHYNYYNHAQ